MPRNLGHQWEVLKFDLSCYTPLVEESKFYPDLVRDIVIETEWHRSAVPRGGGGYCHIWAIWVCAAVKGMVFKQFTLA